MTFRSRFRQINLLYTLLLVAMVSNQLLVRYLSITGGETLRLITEETVLYSVFVPFFLMLVFVREDTWSRIAQIMAIIGLGVVVVAVIAPRELGGDLNFLLAAALAYKYDLLREGTVWKLVLMLGTLVVSRVAATFFAPDLSLARVLNQVVITILAVPFLYWVFEAEFLRIRREKRRLEALQENNEPFVEFGRNVTGIVHDFKNDLGLFHTFGQYLKISIGEPIEASQVRLFRKYVDRLGGRIHQIMNVTQASQRYVEEEISLQELIRSTLYVFQSNLDFKRVVTFDVRLPETPYVVRLAPAALISILENLVRNSCEALVETYGGELTVPGKAVLSVELLQDTEGLLLVVRDTGPGISFCGPCRESNCLDCPEFSPGYTTKSDGSGVGIVTIRRHARRFGLPVHLTSRRGEGVTATVRISSSRLAEVVEPEYQDVSELHDRRVGVDG